MEQIQIGDFKVKVVNPDEVEKYLTSEDKEIDLRVQAAVDEAIRKNSDKN
jgi:hypothetical protein